MIPHQFVSSTEPGFPSPCYRTTDGRFRIMRRALLDGWVVFDTSGVQLFEHVTLPGVPAAGTYTATLAEAATAITRARAWERRYEAYAGKFLAEHDDPENCDDRAYPTDAAMAATFAPCGRPAKPEWYPYIHDAVIRQRAAVEGTP